MMLRSRTRARSETQRPVMRTGTEDDDVDDERALHHCGIDTWHRSTIHGDPELESQ